MSKAMGSMAMLESKYGLRLLEWSRAEVVEDRMAEVRKYCSCSYYSCLGSESSRVSRQPQ